MASLRGCLGCGREYLITVTGGLEAGDPEKLIRVLELYGDFLREPKKAPEPDTVIGKPTAEQNQPLTPRS